MADETTKIPEVPFEAPPAAVKRETKAAPPEEPPQGTPPPSEQSQIARLRTFRATVQGLLQIIEEVSTGKVKLDYYADFLAKVKADGDQLLTDIEAHQDPTDDDVDEIREIRSSWEQLKPIPIFKDGVAAKIDEAERLQNFTQIQALCRDMIAHVGSRTIPARLADWLDRGRPGYYVPFHAVFADELPNVEDRNHLLQQLAWSPTTLESGLVDAANGLIYRYDKRRNAQYITAGGIIGIFALFSLIALLLPSIGGSWVADTIKKGTTLAVWVAVLGGVIIHIVIDTAKKMQSDRQSPPVLAAADILPRINAHFGTIAFKLLLALIGAISLVIASHTDITTAFLAGYSLDSVIGLIGSTLDGRSASTTDALKKELADRNEN